MHARGRCVGAGPAEGLERVLVLGSPGSGKSTFARQLAAILGLPVFHLDQIHWNPGWVATPVEQFREVQRALVRRERWIIDGDYGATLEVRLAAADTVIVLDLPRAVCLWRVLQRWLRFRGRARPDMAARCEERLTWEFVWWIWTYPRRRRAGILERLRALAGEKRVEVLRSQADVERFVSTLARPSG